MDTMGTTRHKSRGFCWRRAVFLTLLQTLSACVGSRDPLAPHTANPAVRTLGRFDCTVTLTGTGNSNTRPSGSIRCSSPHPQPDSGSRRLLTPPNGAAPHRDGVTANDVILGSTDDVALNFGAASYAIAIFSVPVSITNLLAQPLATTDGASAAGNGTRVFNNTAPTVTSGV